MLASRSYRLEASWELSEIRSLEFRVVIFFFQINQRASIA